MSKGIDDSEFVDKIYADAAGVVAREMHDVSPKTDPPYSDRMSDWEAIIDAVHSERESLRAMNNRVVDRVMSKLCSVEAPQRSPSWGRAWVDVARHRGVPMAVCGLIMITGIFVVQSDLLSRSLERLKTNSGPMLESTRINAGTTSVPLVIESAGDQLSLQRALDAAPEGSRISLKSVNISGGFVFRKRMTIVSGNGSVFVGSS